MFESAGKRKPQVTVQLIILKLTVVITTKCHLIQTYLKQRSSLSELMFCFGIISIVIFKTKTILQFLFRKRIFKLNEL